jgi:hypothetical protein
MQSPTTVEIKRNGVQNHGQYIQNIKNNTMLQIYTDGFKSNKITDSWNCKLE